MIDPFLDACGASGPLVLDTESAGGPGSETRAFDLPFVLVGRDPRSDLRLSHAEVSDRHAYLQLVDGQLLYMDLGSRSGIHQGGRCQRLGFLERDQAIRIGPYRVRLMGGDAGGVLPSADLPCPPLPLELSHRSVRHSRCELPRGLALVGSSADCQIRLIDPSLSNYHCSLIRTPQGVWVVDLLGQGGVRVNGQDVAYAQLHEGDALQIGRSVIRLISRDDTPSPGVLVRAPAAVARVVDHEPSGTPQAAQTVDLVERVVGPMVSQIGLLQQQMVEEFHQAREMLFNTFSSLHQEQTAFINQELEQIRQLSQELHELRSVLEQQTRLLADHSAAAPTETAAPSPAPSPTRAIAMTKKSLNEPESLPAGPAQHNHHSNGHQSTSRFTRSETENLLIRAHNEQAHAKLCVRIARLKKKQQTRWEKLMAMLPGGKAPLPEKAAGSGG